MFLAFWTLISFHFGLLCFIFFHFGPLGRHFVSFWPFEATGGVSFTSSWLCPCHEGVGGQAPLNSIPAPAHKRKPESGDMERSNAEQRLLLDQRARAAAAAATAAAQAAARAPARATEAAVAARRARRSAEPSYLQAKKPKPLKDMEQSRKEAALLKSQAEKAEAEILAWVEDARREYQEKERAAAERVTSVKEFFSSFQNCYPQNRLKPSGRGLSVPRGTHQHSPLHRHLAGPQQPRRLCTNTGKPQ